MTKTVTLVNISHTLNNHAVNHAVNKICTINKASNLNVFLLMSLEYVVDLKTINICRSMNNKLSLHAFSWSLACTLYLWGTLYLWTHVINQIHWSTTLMSKRDVRPHYSTDAQLEKSLRVSLAITASSSVGMTHTCNRMWHYHLRSHETQFRGFNFAIAHGLQQKHVYETHF